MTSEDIIWFPTRFVDESSRSCSEVTAWNSIETITGREAIVRAIFFEVRFHGASSLSDLGL